MGGLSEQGSLSLALPHPSSGCWCPCGEQGPCWLLSVIQKRSFRREWRGQQGSGASGEPHRQVPAAHANQPFYAHWHMLLPWGWWWMEVKCSHPRTSIPSPFLTNIFFFRKKLFKKHCIKSGRLFDLSKITRQCRQKLKSQQPCPTWPWASHFTFPGSGGFIIKTTHRERWFIMFFRLQRLNIKLCIFPEEMAKGKSAKRCRIQTNLLISTLKGTFWL